MKILVVSPTLPVPADNGGAIRVFNLVRHLAASDDIDFLALDDGRTPEQDVQDLRDVCAHVHIVVPKKRKFLEDACLVAGNMVRGEPFYTKYVDYAELKARLRALTRATRYDIIHFEHSHMAGLLDHAERAPGSGTVLSTENVVFDQFWRMSRYERNPWEKLKLLMTSLPMRWWEPMKAGLFDTVIAVCDRDRRLLLAGNPRLDIRVVPNGVDTEAYRPTPRQGRPENILIVGSMDYPPNCDAVQYFLRHIFPRVRAQAPACTLTIVGRQPPESILRLHHPPEVTVCPTVPDVKSFYQNALVSIVALRSGGGSRLKILEALALGTPVVSTRVGCEGLDVRDGRSILIGADPADFASKVVSLIRDPVLWNALADRGRRLVQEQYDWKQIAAALRDQYQRCLDQKSGVPSPASTRKQKGIP
jgi:glycosyltransferase involved in cell wall biosynthesis